MSDFSKRMPQSCVMIGCTRRAGAGSTQDRPISFVKNPHRRALWIAGVQQKDLEPKTRKTIMSLAVIIYGKAILRRVTSLHAVRSACICCMHPQSQSAGPPAYQDVFDSENFL